jgi:ABC-type multidrug transport system fused ATPase/permease subunit
MFERRERIERWFADIVEKFRQKGAVSPDKAMTAEELGLPPRFQEAMKRRLGRLGVFVEVNGKYYLSEERLKQVEELRSARGGAWNPRNRIVTLRLVQLVTIVLFVTLFLVNIFVQSWELRIVSAVFLVVWLVIAMLQIYFLSRFRRRYSSQQVSKARAPTLYLIN